MQGRAARAQSAIDFITSYGFVILIIAIAVYVVFQLGVFNYSASPQYCYSSFPFSCLAYAISTNGVLAIVLSQSSGGILNVSGLACATSSNTTKVGPEFGNANVLPYKAKPGFYPNPELNNGIVMYPGTQTLLYTNCYGGSGLPLVGSIGAPFTGYLWVNYTFSGLPSSYHNIGEAVTINVKYT